MQHLLAGFLPSVPLYAYTPTSHLQVTAVDTNGAGDTFATAYMLAMAARSLHPGSTANWAASRAVMQPQACKPACIESAIKKDSRWARLGAWLRAAVSPMDTGVLYHNC